MSKFVNVEYAPCPMAKRCRPWGHCVSFFGFTLCGALTPHIHILWRRAESAELGEAELGRGAGGAGGSGGRRDAGWGRALTYSTPGARAEDLTNEQGLQGRLEEGSGLLHALQPLLVGRLGRQSWSERPPSRSRVFFIHFPSPALSRAFPRRMRSHLDTPRLSNFTVTHCGSLLLSAKGPSSPLGSVS